MPIIGNKNVWVVGKYQDHLPRKATSLMVADPVYDTGMVNDIVALAIDSQIPSIIFCSVEDGYRLERTPSQTAHWIKQPSTKNTVKRYSCFVELITFWNDVKFHKLLHWSTRTGCFTDQLIDNSEHPWKKPESLIEKLIRSHYPGYGEIYDPCAGSGTVHEVCKRLSIPSYSVEVEAKYAKSR